MVKLVVLSLSFVLFVPASFAQELDECDPGDPASEALAAAKCTLVALPFIGYTCINNSCNQHCALLADFEDGQLTNFRCRCKKKRATAAELNEDTVQLE